MTQLLLISDNKITIKELEKIFSKNSFDYITVGLEEEAENIIQEQNPDIVIYDYDCINLNIILTIRKLKFILQTKDIRSLLLFNEKNINYDVLKYVNSYVTKPVNEKLLLAAINSNLQLRETFSILAKNNNELAKSLYQLNVLYNTSTQLAGYLDKEKLIEIMTDGLEQSLSLSLCYALILNEANDIKLIIKSLFPISQRLENAIKLRALLSYKSLYNPLLQADSASSQQLDGSSLQTEDSKHSANRENLFTQFPVNLSTEDIKSVKHHKDNFGEYDLNIFNYDNLFAPINIKNKFYGIIEVFREQDFAQDDTKCFTTLIKQVSLPLESAILYEEIKDTNIKLEKLERLKSEFISIVSHELRTPLTSINSALDIILKGTTGDISPAAEKFLNLAKRNVTRLSAIIYDLLDLSKIEAGKMEFRFEKANINASIELVKNTLESWAKEQNITINLNLDNSLELVYIDSQRMEQVLTNLISNAVKFTQENGTIEVTSSKMSPDEIRNNSFFKTLPEHLSKEYVKVSVKDNGIGIAQENWEKVFEQFKQIENSLSRKVGGSGLGLPIAKRLMDAHKGFIWLESELNKGTTFYLAIPIMSEKEIFELSLEQDIQKAKQEHINIALISLCENYIEGNSFIDKILAEDIIRKTSVFNDYSCVKDGKKYYYSYSVDIDSFVFDFEVRKLQTFIKMNSQEYHEYDILYSSVLFPQDSETLADLIEKLNFFQKGDINEENTYS